MNDRRPQQKEFQGPFDIPALVMIAVVVLVALALFLGAVYGALWCVSKITGADTAASSQTTTKSVPVDPAYEIDSVLARQMLAAHTSPASETVVTIRHSPGDVQPLAAGELADRDKVSRCTLPQGGELIEIAPDHTGRILVRYGTNTLPVMRGLDDCSGGEVFFVTTDELNVIADR